MSASEYACLLLHGYSGSPFEMEPLAEALSVAGYTCELPCLPGHCRDLEAFRHSRFDDWAKAAEEACRDLLHQGKRVVVLGLSMGGSLGLYLAQRRPLAGLVTIAAPVFLYRFFPWKGSSPMLPLIPLLRYIRPVVTTPVTSEQAKQIAPSRGYEGFEALAPLSSLLQGLRRLRRDLERVRAPLLAMHCPRDTTVPVENAWEIMLRTQSSSKTLRLLPIAESITSRHVLTTHRDTRTAVQQAALRFINDLARQENPVSIPEKK